MILPLSEPCQWWVRKGVLLPALLCLLLASPVRQVLAQAPDTLNTFVQAVQSQNWTEAGTLAEPLLDEFEGTPRFDYYYALLLIETGRTQEAIFTLERVLAFHPQQQRARLELARAYFINNNLHRSRVEFAQVLSEDPPQNVRANIEQFLARIDAAERSTRTQFQLYAGLDFGWNTNINNGSTLSGELAPNLLGLNRISDASRAQESYFGRVRLGGQWVQPTSLTNAWIYSLQAQSLIYPEADDFNQNDLAARVQHLHRSDRTRYQAALNSSYSWIDGDPWQLSLGLNGQWQASVWQRLWAGPVAQAQWGWAQGGNRSDTFGTRLGTVLTLEENSRQHEGRLVYAQQSIEGNDNGHLEWDGVGTHYQLAWQWPNRINTTFRFQYDWRTYRGDDLLFVVSEGSQERKRREDQFLSAETAINWPVQRWLSSRTSLKYEWLNSNINAYSREQWVFSQSLTVLF